ncbi:MAG: vitamin K epoxide reductase family protein, partial [archaeon]|nr:vitamin K epoxide reductase family protein [archaeon]
FWTTGLVWFPLSLIIGIVAFKYYAEVILIPFLMIGNIFTIYLWYLELAVIHLICPVCLSLYVINYALTGTAIWIAVA